MGVLDADALVAEISPDAPCGENLEYDAGFIALERDILGKPESQYGDTVIPAEPPDWKQIKKSALDLAARTRDLRVAMHLTRAVLHMDGVAGFADGLTLLRSLIEQRWDRVHPELDPDDDNDPTMRVNTVAGLCNADTVVREFRETPLVASRMAGRFSLRDVDVASGEMPPGKDGVKPDPATIEAAFTDVDAAELQATSDHLERAVACVEGIEAALTSKVGASRAADFSALTREIRRAAHVVRERLARRGIGTVEEVAPAADGASPAEAARGAQPISGAIASRDDVLRMLDKICEYYSRFEPSSPVPMLLERAKRLVSMSFVDIVRDLAPGGMEQVAVIRGVSEEE